MSYKTSLDLVEGCCAFTINKLWAFKHSKFSCCEIGAIVHKDQNRWTALRIFDSSNSLASSGSRLNLCVVVRFDNLISYAQKQSVYAVDCASINRIVPDNTPRVSGLQMADLRARYSTPQYSTVQYSTPDLRGRKRSSMSFSGLNPGPFHPPGSRMSSLASDMRKHSLISNNKVGVASLSVKLPELFNKISMYVEIQAEKLAISK